MSGKVRYAASLYTWADCPQSLTLDGLHDKRHTEFRSIWARVIAGTDSQLASVIMKTYAANFNLPPAANLKFAIHVLPSFERMVCTGYFPMDRWRDFVAGWEAANGL